MPHILLVVLYLYQSLKYACACDWACNCNFSPYVQRSKVYNIPIYHIWVMMINLLMTFVWYTQHKEFRIPRSWRCDPGCLGTSGCRCHSGQGPGMWRWQRCARLDSTCYRCHQTWEGGNRLNGGFSIAMFHYRRGSMFRNMLVHCWQPVTGSGASLQFGVNDLLREICSIFGLVTVRLKEKLCFLFSNRLCHCL